MDRHHIFSIQNRKESILYLGLAEANLRGKKITEPGNPAPYVEGKYHLGCFYCFCFMLKAATAAT